MNIIDIAIIGIVLFNLFIGFRVGIISSITGLVGWIAALFIGAHYAKWLAPLFANLFAEPILQVALAFLVLVLGALTVLWAIERMLKSWINKASLGGFEKMAGGAFGAVKGLIIVLAILSPLTPWLQQTTLWQNARLANALSPYAPSVLAIAKEIAGSAWSSLSEEPLYQQPYQPSYQQQEDNTAVNSTNTY